MHDIMSKLEYGVLIFLALLNVISFAIAIERSFFYSRVKQDDYSSMQEYEIDLTKRLHLIASIGSNAPFIGLFGTILGIMQTFVSIGASQISDVNSIMTGLAMALKATASGLVTAIPATVLYNMLLRKVNVLILRKEAADAGKEH